VAYIYIHACSSKERNKDIWINVDSKLLTLATISHVYYSGVKNYCK